MVKRNQINIIIIIFMFLTFTFSARLMSFAGVKISGFEYFAWIFFSIVLLVVNFNSSFFKFRISSLYLLLLFFLILYCLVNYFFVNVSISSYAQGMFFSFLFAFNFILFYNLGLSKSDFFLLAEVIICIITLIAILAYFERIFFPGEFQSYFLRGVITLVKDPAFAAALFNINIILSLSIYLVNKQRKYIYIVIFSVITISLLLFLKALIAAIIICFVFITIYYNSQVTKLFLYALAVFFFLMLMIMGKPLVEEIKYKAELYFGQGSERTPRNALYIAGFKMARDHFPFGSGQGSFGSYPVGKEYSKVYYDYNLDKVHGLGPEDAQGKTDSNFIFDTYWSSVLGEMGFIAGFNYLFLWLLPAIKSRRFLKSQDLEIRAIAFFVFMTIVSVFIESIASPIPGQLQFIVIYSGLGAIGYRILKTQPS